MKWPEQKTRWSFVTRTLKRSAMAVVLRPGSLPGQGHDTFAQGGEQASRDEVGAGAGVEPPGPQPGVELGHAGRVEGRAAAQQPGGALLHRGRRLGPALA